MSYIVSDRTETTKQAKYYGSMYIEGHQYEFYLNILIHQILFLNILQQYEAISS